MDSFFSDLSVFNSKSNRELRFSKRIYWIISFSWINRLGEFAVYFFKKTGIPFPTLLVKKSIFKQFCGGEKLEECDISIQQLAKANIHTFLDYSVEANSSNNSRHKVFKELKKAILFASKNNMVPCVVFKSTALVKTKDLKAKKESRQSYLNGKRRIRLLCQIAHNNDVQLMIDAEESWFQKTIDDIALEMCFTFNTKKTTVFNTYQFYRKDALERLKKDHQKCIKNKATLGVKLVRGAYLEKESRRAKLLGYENPLNISKEKTDDLYNEALKYCVENIDTISICCASHNEWSNEYMTQLMNRHSILPSDERIYFTQLYGMSDNISYKLAQEGYNVSKYLPYGKVREVIPYLIRRSRENQSVKGQIGRELKLIKEVLKLRK